MPKASFPFEDARNWVLSTEWKVEFNIVSTGMQFIDYPQIKYLSAIGVFLAEVFRKREKKVSSGNRWGQMLKNQKKKEIWAIGRYSRFLQNFLEKWDR